MLFEIILTCYNCLLTGRLQEVGQLAVYNYLAAREGRRTRYLRREYYNRRDRNINLATTNLVEGRITVAEFLIQKSNYFEPDVGQNAVHNDFYQQELDGPFENVRAAFRVLLPVNIPGIPARREIQEAIPVNEPPPLVPIRNPPNPIEIIQIEEAIGVAVEQMEPVGLDIGERGDLEIGALALLFALAVANQNANLALDIPRPDIMQPLAPVEPRE